MLRSMTGFGSGRAQVETEEISVEIRSVNGKFCEVKVRLPRELASLEAEAVRLVKARLARGGVDLVVRRGLAGGPTLAPKVDEVLAERITTTFRALRDRLGLAGDVTLADVVSVPGVVGVEERAPDMEAARAALLEAAGQALDVLCSMREREGEALRADLSRRLGTISELTERVATRAPEAVRQTHERLATRVEELTDGIPLDPERLAQEVALLAERSDVAEELTRLRSHIAQFRGLLESDEPAGRRMDFLVQELNREVNTIASKSTWVGAAALTVDLKAELERIREQVQNVE